MTASAASTEQSQLTGAASVASEDANAAPDFSFSNFMNTIDTLCTSSTELSSFIQEGAVPVTN